MAEPTAQEVLMWQLINRARLDPLAEAAHFGIDLNEGLTPGTLAGGSRQPLAFNSALFAAADLHSQRMIDLDYFAHNDPNDGSTPQTRANAAGYSGSVGENIAWEGSTGAIDATNEIIAEQQLLFVDSGVDGRGHRLNILDNSYQEVGVGQVLGTYQIYNASMVTQDFGIPSATGQFLTGVVFTDSDANNFYSVGEGRGAVNVSYDNGLGGAGTTATGTAGAYSQRVAAGTELVSFSGGGLASPVVLNATIAAGTNAEIDLEISGGNTIVRTSVSISEASGIGHIVGLGTNGLNLAGDSGADIIDGTTGNDTIFAGAASDTVNGGDGNDTLVANDSGADVFANTPDTLNGGNGNDTIYADSADTISGGAGFDVLYAINDNPMTIDLGATSIEYMRAGFGNDTINAATQTTAVEVYGGGGNDTITGSNFDDIIWAGVGNDTVVGNDGNDVIVGDLGSDSLSGGAGNDQIYADNTDSFIDGGSGFDALYINTSGANSNGMSVDMAATHFEFVADFFGGNDTINGSGLSVAAQVYAAGGNDTVTGGSGADFLWGEAGNDTIVGNAGNDVLVGGTGSDVLTGGPGTDAIYGNSGNGGDGVQDTFVFGAGWGTDFVFDFEHGIDMIDMTALHITFADLVITSDGPHAHIGYAGNLISVANAAGQLTAGDFLF